MPLDLLRKQMNMTQKEFAVLLGMSQQFVSNIETGKRQMRIKTAKNIANRIGCDWKQLYE